MANPCSGSLSRSRPSPSVASGLQRVGLGAMVESLLGLHLEKGHSAADWSTRPLPADWLVYAALDVEVLVELRDVLEAELVRQGKLAWAHEEFEAVRQAPLPAPRTDPWRRTSGMHRMRNRRQLAAVRAMWEARDAMARRRDIAPGRILPDAAIMAAVTAAPASAARASPQASRPVVSTLSGQRSCSAAAPAASAASGSARAGSTSQAIGSSATAMASTAARSIAHA